MKKFLLCAVPTQTIYATEIALPSLSAQLKKNGYDVKVCDFNISFFRHIYQKSFLKKSVEKAKENYFGLKTQIDSENTLLNDDLLIQKYSILNDFFLNHIEIGERVPETIEKALHIFKNEKLFYNPKLLDYAHTVIQYADKIACLPYAPFSLRDEIPSSYEDICKIIFNKAQNIFIDFFEQKVQEIIHEKYDYVGISISYSQQVIPGLTLAYLLKKNSNVHVNIGGNYFSRLVDYIPNYKDFFEKFVDSLSYGEGENSIVELAKYIDGKIDIDDVPHLIYKNSQTGKIIITKKAQPVILSKIQPPDFSDLDFSEYFLPEPFLPIQIQRGCYWNKCSFCVFHFSKTRSAKKLEQVIAELKSYQEKYNISNFHIIDESITPEYVEKLCDSILANNLVVYLSMSARLEEKYNYNLLKKMYKAGFRNIMWGLESASEKIQKLINKGINLNVVPKILRNADKVGLFNVVYFMTYFPTSTYKDDEESINFIKKYTKFIHNFAFSNFTLPSHSDIFCNPDKYEITKIDDNKQSRISLVYEFDRKKSVTIQERGFIEEKKEALMKEKILFSFTLTSYFLYNSKFGLGLVKKTLLSTKNQISIIDRIKQKIFR